MLKYEKTNWVDGTTILRASHMEKIEKGITDIISENNAIYTDEDIRKSNEKQRQEEHSRKMNEVSEVVSDIQKDYDSLQKIIIDENASANLQNQINQTNSQLEHKVNNDDVDFIDVTKFGLKSEDNFDNTELFNALINKGYRNFYFPPGVFELNIVIEKTSVRIKGSGIGKTILKPHIDSDVITLTSERSSIQNFYLSDLSIENKTDFILANGINIKGAGINDWHKMERIKIMNMLNGIYISGRTIWSTFRDIQIMYS